MYAYPVFRPPRTPDGLKWTEIAFGIYLIALGLQLAFSLLIASLLTGGAAVGTILSLLTVSIVTFALGLVVVILYFVGFGYMYGGRSEFGPAHARNMEIALYTLIAAVVIAPVGAIVAFFTSLTTLFTFSPDPDALANAVFTSIAVGCVTPAVVGALTLWQVSQILPIGAGGFAFDFGLGIPSALGSGLGILTTVLFFLTYRGAAMRIRTGELKPQMPPLPLVPVMPVYPYPMVPPAPPPAPAPPPQQPPGPGP